MDIYTADFKNEVVTLRDLFNSPVDINCDVEIYDCTGAEDGASVLWDEMDKPTVSGFGSSLGRHLRHTPELLDAPIRYITINGVTHALVIEVAFE